MKQFIIFVAELFLINCGGGGGEKICDPDTTRCYNNTVEVCNKSRTGWKFLKECPKFCVEGQCVEELCIPNCTDKECGDDGCGGKCGECKEWGKCNEKGKCIPSFCVPSCEEKECGDDGCDGICGFCKFSEKCVEGKCICAPSCGNKECGSDGCGGSCGDCSPFSVCVNGKCICTPKCEGKECGSDGCGGSCANCADGSFCVGGKCSPCEKEKCGLYECCQENEICNNNYCCVPNAVKGCKAGNVVWFDSCGLQGEVAEKCEYGCKDAQCQACVPDCEGKECGDNGCGGICGTCPAGKMCNKYGKCTESQTSADCGYKNIGKDGVEMCKILPGTFFMGCKDVMDENCWEDEIPFHQVTISKEIYIDRYEVTNEKFKKCVDDGKCSAPQICKWGEAVWKNGTFPPELANHPVVCVNYFDAETYCKWAGKRMPTEAEWEYAARGIEGFIYPWGNKFQKGFANCNESSCFDGIEKTAEVGTFKEGITYSGLYDIAGNVSEWCFDWYKPNFYNECKENCVDPQGPQNGVKKVIRGGSFKNEYFEIRTSSRLNLKPSGTDSGVGFRCAYNKEEIKPE